MLLITVLLASSVGMVFSMASSTFAETSASTETNVIETDVAVTRSRPQFNVDVIYAYTGKNKYAGAELNSTFNGVPMHPISLYPVIIYLNFTHVSDAETEACDAEIEVYLIEISSDKGSKENYACFFGTNYDPTFSDENMLESAISQIHALIGAKLTNGLSGIFNPDMSTNQSLWFKVGSLDSTTSKPSGMGLWSAGEPNAITLSVSRLGWIVLDGASISNSYADPKDSIQINLAKTEEGFLYNKIPQDKIVQADAFHPIDLYKTLD